jgi:hypothetical protein
VLILLLLSLLYDYCMIINNSTHLKILLLLTCMTDSPTDINEQAEK